MGSWNDVPVAGARKAPTPSGWDAVPVAGGAPPEPVQGAPGGVPPASPTEATPRPAPASAPVSMGKAINALPNDQFWAIKALRALHTGIDNPRIAVGEGLEYALEKTGLSSPEKSARVRAQLAKDFQANEDAANAVPGGRVLQMVPQMGMGPVGAGPAGLLGKMGMGAVTGGTMAALQPNGEGTFDLGKEAVKTAAGAVLGAVMPAVVEGGAKVLAKGADLLAGTKLGTILGIKQTLNPKYAGAPELSAELDKAGITAHTVGDITGDPAIVAQEAALGRNNPAMMDRRLLENKQAADYAQSVVDDLKATVKQTGWRNLKDVEAAAAEPGKRQGTAKQLLTAIQNSGDDWKEIAQQSGNLQLFVNKLRADQLYDKAEAIARLHGPVQPTNLVGSLKASIGAIQRNTAADQTAVPYLQRILAGIEDGTQKTGFGDMREMRSALNNKLQEYLDPKAVIQGSADSRPYLQNTIAALERDLEKFANSKSSGLRNAWKAATDHYRENVVPYKEAAFGRALADTDPLKAAQLFKTQNPAQQARFFDLLDPKGKAAVRAGLIEDAISAGEKTQRGVMGQSFSAAQAAGKLEDLHRKGVMGVAFQGGEDTWAASGLAKILRTVDRSDNVAFIPKTGMTAEMIGAKAEGNTTLIGAAAKAYDWLNRDRLFQLYTDPKGKALLVRASGLTPGSQAMQNLVSNELPKVLGIAAGQSVQK